MLWYNKVVMKLIKMIKSLINERKKYMYLLISCLKIISIPLIIIVGESSLNKNTKTIAFLILTVIFNNLLGSIIWFAILMISVLNSTYLFIISIIIIGFIFFSYLITINMYIKRKMEINNALFITLCVVGLLSGFFIVKY